MIGRNPRTDLDTGFVVVSISDQETGEEIAHLPEQKIISIPDIDEVVALRELIISNEDDVDTKVDSFEAYRVTDRNHMYSLVRPDDEVAEEAETDDILYTTIKLYVTPIEEDIDV